jgi:integral membrane protein
MSANWISFLRRVTLIEGASFLLLLGVAMPLKYFANIPLATKIAGWTHGVLLIIVCYALLQVMLKTSWPLMRCALVFGASLVPFGPFMLDRRMLAWVRESEVEA